jgi:REP element-mobilizing transposase RayT
MTRLARVIAVDVPHHVTQRGNARRFILDCDANRMAYLNLLRRNIELHGLGLIGYCLMSNHVHLVVTPHNADGLGLALRQLNCCALDSFRLFTVSSPQIEEDPFQSGATAGNISVGFGPGSGRFLPPRHGSVKLRA